MPSTRRDKDVTDQASGRSWRDIPVGCAAVGIVLLCLAVAGAAVVAMFVGIELFAQWIVYDLIKPLMGPPAFALIGAALILFAGWALFRLATGHAPPGTSRRDMVITVAMLIGIALLGVVFLLGAFGPQAPAAPGF